MNSSDISKKLFDEACRHFVGGVNSPVRSFQSVGGTPLFISRGKGSRVWSADGGEYIDYVGSWGPAILGHAPPLLLQAIHDASKNGFGFGAPHIKEIELARWIKEAFPTMELLRFVNSGTEAAMSAIRVARGFTGKSKIIKFDGGYHGHADFLLVKAGSGAQSLGVPDSSGVPPEFVQQTLIARYNDLNSVKKICEDHQGKIAGVIVEPILGNMGCIPPAQNFLGDLRKLTLENDILLIFDEVMTGFRVAFGGAQELYGVKPDLTCLGKIIGGGLPVGAYGGRREIMEMVAPMGPVYQAGTMSGNPLAMAAGVAALTELRKPHTYQNLEEKGTRLENGLREIAVRLKVPFQINRVGSMLTCFFSDKPVTDAVSARATSTESYSKFFHGLLNAGITWAPSPFESVFISLAHTHSDLDDTLRIMEQVMTRLF